MLIRETTNVQVCVHGPLKSASRHFQETGFCKATMRHLKSGTEKVGGCIREDKEFNYALQ
jgi:hypothetical protein